MYKRQNIKSNKISIDLGLLILRISIGTMMIVHGIAKISHGIGFIEQQLTISKIPEFVAYGVFAGELLAPLFIIIGLCTRIAASILAINCIAAAMLVHSNELLMLNEHGGWAVDLLGLYFFGALTLVFTGGGRYSTSSKHWCD